MLLQANLIPILAAIAVSLSAIVSIWTYLIAKRKMCIHASMPEEVIHEREQEKTEFTSHTVERRSATTPPGYEIREVEGYDVQKGTIFSETNKTEIRKRVGLAAEVFDRYGDESRAIIHFNVKDKSKVDDIFLEFFMSIVRKPIPSNIQDISAYLYRAVTNDVIDVFRQRKCHQDHIQKYAECRKHFAIQEDPQNTVTQTENTKKLFHLIESRIPKREAVVVIQRFGQGFNTTDTAEKMNVNKSIISRYFTAALKKMCEFVPEKKDDEI